MNILKKKFRKIRSGAFLKQCLDDVGISLERIGSDYGGWYAPVAALQPNAVAFCVGAGEDVSFDVELNARYGMRVFTIDPTPRAKHHVERLYAAVDGQRPVAINGSRAEFYDLSNFAPDRFSYLDIGVWIEDGTSRFFVPRNSAHVSHSIVNLQQTDEFFEAECRTLKSLCSDYDISTDFALLKLDIEGAEYAVINNMVEDNILPDVVCVEFDEGRDACESAVLERISKAIDALKSRGYRVAHIDEWNFLFIQDRFLSRIS